MPVTLDPAVAARLEEQFGLLTLVYMEVPGNAMGFYNGPRELSYGGATYQGSRLLDAEGLLETLDNDTEERELRFSGLVESHADLLTTIESLNYIGAPVTVSVLVVNTETHEIAGLAQTSFHEIYDLSYQDSPVGDGKTDIDLNIILRSRGYTGPRQTNTIRSEAEHKADFDATDTFYENIGEVRTVNREWGQRSG